MSVVGRGTPVRACFSGAAGGEKECFEAHSAEEAVSASVPPRRQKEIARSPW
jgi:hypothetical protein